MAPDIPIAILESGAGCLPIYEVYFPVLVVELVVPILLRGIALNSLVPKYAG